LRQGGFETRPYTNPDPYATWRPFLLR